MAAMPLSAVILSALYEFVLSVCALWHWPRRESREVTEDKVRSLLGNSESCAAP